MQTLLGDFRYALRQLRKNPGFTTVAVLALALGIGFSTIIFSVFYNGVLRPFPYRHAERLAAINLLDTQNGGQGDRSGFHLDEVAASVPGARPSTTLLRTPEWMSCTGRRYFRNICTAAF